MSGAVIRSVFEKIFASGCVGETLDVCWHAGEPLTLSVAYYEEAFSLINSLRPSVVRIRHAFQTNGTRINDDWCALFRTHAVRVGVSVDGPRQLHDSNRVTRKGEGTFDATTRGIRKLQEHSIPFGVITVLTRRSLQHPVELYEFYETNKITRVAFNIEEIEGANTASSLNAAGVEEEFREFLRTFLRLVQQRKTISLVRELDSAFASILFSSREPLVNTQVRPFSTVTVDWAGNFSTFSPELLGMKHERYGDFRLGNFRTDDIASVKTSEKFRLIHREIEQGVQECRNRCEYFAVCGGGAPANKLYETGTFAATETMYCRLNVKCTTDLALDVLERHLGERLPG
jgi:uncharacterized protein